MIPLLDLKRQYAALRGEIDAAMQRVAQSQAFILGPEVERFEKTVAEHCGVRYAIGVASGTDALIVALRGVGVKPGDAVLLPSFTFFATAGAVSNLGAIPAFVDIEPASFHIDPQAVAKRLERDADLRRKAKAVVPVHLFGQAAEMDPLLETARKYDLRVVEDAAQSIGATYRGKTACSMGDCGTLSFFPTKNLGAFGDGGMILTQDERLAETLRMLRVHGSKKTYVHELVGFNSRLDAIQAAVLAVKLPHLNAWSQRRAKNALLYRELLAGAPGLTLPAVAPERSHIFHQFTVRVHGGRRDALKKHLESKGIGSAIYYPIPLHLQQCFADLGGKPGDLPHTEKASEEVLSLPIFPELTPQEIETVAKEIRSFLG